MRIPAKGTTLGFCTNLESADRDLYSSVWQPRGLRKRAWFLGVDYTSDVRLVFSPDVQSLPFF